MRMWPSRSPTAPRTLAASEARADSSAPLLFSGASKKEMSCGEQKSMGRAKCGRQQQATHQQRAQINADRVAASKPAPVQIHLRLVSSPTKTGAPTLADLAQQGAQDEDADARGQPLAHHAKAPALRAEDEQRGRV